ncbi:MAG: LysM peptidoglycan-binding domain-containing protein [Bacteroidales bacterium]
MVRTKKQIAIGTVALTMLPTIFGFSQSKSALEVMNTTNHEKVADKKAEKSIEKASDKIEASAINKDYLYTEEVNTKDTVTLLDIDEKYQEWVRSDETDILGEGDSLVLAPLGTSDAAYVDRLSRINSAVPLTYNKEVRKYIDLYTGSWSRTIARNLALSEFYFDKIDAVFDKYDIPLEIKYLAVVESDLNPVARSHMGAKGMWQFMFYTAKKYGLEVTSLVDDRYDFMKQTDAAARFLLDLYDIYNDWQLAMAAYNCGPGNVNKAIARSGGKTDFWDIYAYLPKETRTYLPKYIAIMYAMNYADKYGIEPQMDMLSMKSCVQIEVQDYLYISQLASEFDVDEEFLKKMNPQYFKGIIPASENSPRKIFVPVAMATTFYAKEDNLYAMANDKNAVHNVNKKAPVINLSDDTYSSTPVNSAKLSYTVKSGDNIGYIAEWYGVSIDKVRKWNNLRKNIIRVGQKLTVYVPKSKEDHYLIVNNLSFAEKQRRIGVASVGDKKVADGRQYHTVKSGDNYWKIADKYGVSTNELIRLNQGKNSRNLKVGDQIKVK